MISRFGELGVQPGALQLWGAIQGLSQSEEFLWDTDSLGYLQGRCGWQAHGAAWTELGLDRAPGTGVARVGNWGPNLGHALVE